MGLTACCSPRTLRLLLLPLLVLVAFEYIYWFILDASPFHTYVYKPLIQNSILSNLQINEESKLDAEVEAWANLLSLSINKSSNNLSPMINDISNNSLLITKIIDTTLPLCDEIPPFLGPTSANKTEIELKWVENQCPEVKRGGYYSPPKCIARHKVAIIVPYRDREEHLAIFLNHMHPFLMKQQIEYGIFIVEQEGKSEFNRAKLMNVGFVESRKQEVSDWQCFIFHDIDLLPLDTRNLYTCTTQPRHLSAAIDTLQYKLPYTNIFGGACAMSLEQFTDVNGFSNKYWGWGGEDDDMFNRMKAKNYQIVRYDMSIARYTMLNHTKSTPNPKRYQLLRTLNKLSNKDGLSSLEYELLGVSWHHLYTHFLVNIDEHS